MNIWQTISLILLGIVIGFILYIKLKKPTTVVHAETYIEDQDQEIGKIKQKGQSNEQEVEVVLEQPKQSRKEKRLSRKAAHKSRKSK